MIKVNNVIVEPEHFPDGTMKLDVAVFPFDEFIKIEWYYDSEDELLQLIYIVNEIKEVANEYGIYLNEPKRIIAPWAFDNYRKKSKCWKDQSRRRVQWK